MAEKNKGGRPTGYTKELGEEICDMLATTSDGLTTICKNEDMPHVSTVHRWLSKHKEFSDNYARARDAQADLLSDQIISIADDHKDDTIINPNTGVPQMNAEWVARCRLQVDARKWKASKLAPKKYGERVQTEHSGSVAITPVTGIEVK